jgi:hypothetical protein
MNDSMDVPARYRGIWRRTLLQTDDASDTATTVFWLQAARWHADLRIPAGRPDFGGIASLDDCCAARRAWLATQQGFAGITTVRTGRDGELCSWQRLFDLQPPQGQPDEGWMVFEPGLLVETGVHARYLEHWRPVPQTAGRMAVLGLLDNEGGPMAAKELLFLAGPCVMHLSWPRTGSGTISFGTRGAHGYTILHSTLPWLEGRKRTVRFVTQRGAIVDLFCDGKLQQWNVLEIADPLCWQGWT